MRVGSEGKKHPREDVVAIEWGYNHPWGLQEHFLRCQAQCGSMEHRVLGVTEDARSNFLGAVINFWCSRPSLREEPAGLCRLDKSYCGDRDGGIGRGVVGLGSPRSQTGLCGCDPKAVAGRRALVHALDGAWEQLSRQAQQVGA